MLSSGGAQSPFLGLYLFVVLAAAFKWGFNGALLTACACIAFLFSDLILPSSWSTKSPNLMGEGSSFVTTMTLSATLVSLACLLGLLVEREMKRYGDATVITALLRSAVPEPSFRAALSNTLLSVREHFDADQVRLALQEINGDEGIAWEVTRLTKSKENGLHSWKLTESLRQGCFAMPPEKVRHALGLGRTGGGTSFREGAEGYKRRGALGRWFTGLPGFSTARPSGDGFDDLRIVGEQHSPFVFSWSFLATSFSFEGKWLGRLIVYNPRWGWNPSPGLRFLEALVREVGPAVYNKYLVARLRSRAQTRERVRLVQELHDGVVQSLIGLEMQIDFLRRTQTASSDPPRLLQELCRVQALLHNEVAAVREEMQRIKPLEVQPGRLLEFMARAVERFRREQGVSASFVTETEEITLPPRVCTELVRIVQEALANVRKHSGAGKVLVSFARENGHYKLCVEDDGRGFGFTGPLSAAELEASPNCPLVVTERVRAIGGELMIESRRGSGARLEILVPLTTNGRLSSDS
jgi:signal transduction histidine kinase